MPWDCHCDITYGHSYDCGYSSRFDKVSESKVAEYDPNGSSLTRDALVQGVKTMQENRKVNALEGALQQLESAVMRLEDNVERIGNRLEPVLNTEPVPSAESTPTDSEQSYSSVVNSVYRHVAHINNVSNRINQLVYNLDV